MASRLYLSTNTAGYTPPTVRGTWTDSSSGVIVRKLGVKAGSETTQINPSGGLTTAQTNRDQMHGRWVSNPLASAVSISGTVAWIYRFFYNGFGTISTYVSRCHMYVTTGDSDTVRGTLLANRLGLDTYGTTATGFGDGAVAITTVAASAGDRIVVEVGYRLSISGTVSGNPIMYYGGTGATDNSEGSTAAGQPTWVEFSTDMTFAGGGGVPRRPVDRIRHLLVR